MLREIKEAKLKMHLICIYVFFVLTLLAPRLQTLAGPNALTGANQEELVLKVINNILP